jgi:hypothetical protein
MLPRALACDPRFDVRHRVGVERCLTPPLRDVSTAPKVTPQTPSAAALADSRWCGDVIRDRDALRALVEQRLTQHAAAFAACAPKDGSRVVVNAHIVLDVCGRGALGYEDPTYTFNATELCIDAVMKTIPFASIGDMKFWHEHTFTFGAGT